MTDISFSFSGACKYISTRTHEMLSGKPCNKYKMDRFRDGASAYQMAATAGKVLLAGAIAMAFVSAAFHFSIIGVIAWTFVAVAGNTIANRGDAIAKTLRKPAHKLGFDYTSAKAIQKRVDNLILIGMKDGSVVNWACKKVKNLFA